MHARLRDIPTSLRARSLGWAALAAALLAACPAVGTPRAPEAGQRADAEMGRELIKQYGCGTCHTIPGVAGADGLVGPPLTSFSQRSFIAGRLQNSPENLARWIENPKDVDPETAMPDLGVTAEEARSMAAYLHSID
ncbi:MAG TPA: c-type cytochrome [Nitriliruptorales bacterium]|nr:c-type cytochrome [Nitriliruptorales bacterium]